MDRYSSIGIFDSGIGGLTVMKEIAALMPSESIVYLGDTARVPYGTRSAETVRRYSFECARFLMQHNIKLLVIACNTASAVSLDDIRMTIDIPVIGVIEPGAKAALAAAPNRRIGVIGTEATIKSSAYVKAIKALDSSAEVQGLACPLFVPLVEEGWTDGEVPRLAALRYLSGMSEKGIDALVLGCTHYPLLKNIISQVMPDVELIDSAVETARCVKETLAASDMLNTGNSHSTKYFVTDSAERFVSVGERFLDKTITDIKIAVL
ncbi:MAG: glutamate racemase [Dissulfurispiraceae bacterium]|jgi:glutamate racemase|nr:glutamate racemase [Dissulfurispiraceae bacterium]